MDIKDLRYFVAVYEEGGFARAGVRLDTVQSNVSARIRRLELFLDAQLFERRRRGVAVTEKGEKLYRHAKRVIALVEETPAAVRGKEAA
ncbi:MAG TPA: LysR family transcriptional regulator [Burkholderiales bacterium]|nr:LysR family transcriptional regulator [Burkholderiales bacterium]